jgi:hypothetical protein
MAKFIVQQRGGNLKAANKAKLQAFIDGMPDGKNYTLSLEPVKSMKTLPQLGYWHAVVLPHAVDAFLQQGYDTLGEKDVVLNGRTWHFEVKTTEGSVDEQLRLLWMEDMEEDEIRSKANLTTEQMGNLIDFTLNWVAKNLQYSIPDPERTE